MDKTVKLDVDGQQVSVNTFADDVAGVLRKAGVETGPHDTVAPDPTAQDVVASRHEIHRKDGNGMDSTIDQTTRQGQGKGNVVYVDGHGEFTARSEVFTDFHYDPFVQ